jgi:hypothetical protein
MNAFWGGGIDKEGTYLYLPIVDCVYRGNDRLNYRYNIYKVKLWVDSNAEDGIYFFKIISKDYWWW